MQLNGIISRLKKDSTAVWLGNFGSVFLRFALNVVIARLGGANQMGVYVALAALTFIIARFTDLGLPNAIVYFARSQRLSTRKCVSVCLMHSAFMLPASIVLLLSATALGLTNSDSSHLIAQAWLLLSALATVQLLGGLISQLLIPLDAFRSYGIVMILSPLVAMAICFAFGKGIEARKLVIAVLSGEISSAALGLALVLRAMPRVHDAVVLPSVVTIYRYALKSYIGTSMKALSQRADRVILSWFLPNSLLAAYAVAVGLRDNASLPITTHSMLLRNQFVDREQQVDGRKEAHTFLRRELVRWGIIATVIAGTLAIATPFALPALYSNQFHSAVPVFIVLSMTLPMITVSTLCWTALLSSARPGAVSFGLIFGSAINLAALYVGAHIAGVMGACWGAVIASVIAAAWWFMASFSN